MASLVTNGLKKNLCQSYSATAKFLQSCPTLCDPIDCSQYQLQIGTYEEHCQWLNNNGICHLPLMEIEPCAVIAAELQQGGVRRFVFQGIWWDKSLDSWTCLGTDFMTSTLASPHI